jgi:hypothetical protein
MKTAKTARIDDEPTTGRISPPGMGETTDGHSQGKPPRRALVPIQALRTGWHPWLVVLIQAGAAVLTLVIFIGAVVAGIEGLGQLFIWSQWLWQRLGG